MVAACMNLYRNDPITRSVVDTTVTYLGESRPVANTTDAEWNKTATEYFNDYWWPQADARRRPGVDFGTFQRLWSNMAFLQGDMLFPLYNGQLYPVEGIYIETPNKFRRDARIVNGIRTGQAFPHPITHYYMLKPGDNGLITGNEYERVRVSDAIYAPTEYWRPSMLRAVPDLHGVVDALQDFDETQDAVRGKIKAESKIITRERTGVMGRVPGRGLVDNESGERVEISDMGNMMRFKIKGDPEKDFILSEMKAPGNGYVPNQEFMVRCLSAGLGIPMEVILHIWTNGSYTANRAAREDFKAFLMRRWAQRVKVLNQPAWNWVIARGIKRGELAPAPVNEFTGVSQWHKCHWTIPVMKQIDPGKDTKADITRWRSGRDLLEDWARQEGRSLTEHLDARDNELADLERRAKARGMTLREYMPALFEQESEKRGSGGDEPNAAVTSRGRTE